ncbi:type IV toxin-antitoxin system AbiEi family antitoxin domain-containing protein [Myxococcus faecalis]|uniref:type IV toxin-antitoxin system AbiEi family antitoxin domain-containing protein n=1 Tax=Myxococcus faecalis TaxID=3115646 RepID=UPI003CFB8489
MPRRAASNLVPDWNALYGVAQVQAGYFSSLQAKEVGFSLPLLQYHLTTGRLERARRGIFRVRHFPPHPLEEFVVLWLWSDRQGVFSHTTALSLCDLSDVLPSRIHLTLPSSWAQSRVKWPEEVVAHFADVPADERVWHDLVPVTTPLRTLRDCGEGGLSGEHYRQALHDAVKRGLVTAKQLRLTVPPRTSTRRSR